MRFSSVSTHTICTTSHVSCMCRYYARSQGLGLDKVFTLPKTTMIGGDEAALPLSEIVSRLREVYCSSMGVEFMFINDRYKCKH